MADEARDDPYGSLGAVPMPSWSQRWSRMSIEEREAYFAKVAAWPLLNQMQMEHLLQGLPPMETSWIEPPAILESAMAVVHRLRHDIHVGTFPASASPQEFAAWCDHYMQELPGALVQAVRDRVHKSTEDWQAQSECHYTGPVWAPISAAPSQAAHRTCTRGRPKTTPGRNQRIVEAAKRLLLDFAKQGRSLTLTEISVELHGQPVAEGLKRETIQRYLKNQLPLEQAKELAASAARKKKISASR